MDTVAVLFGGLGPAIGFLLLVFLSGFNLSLIFFPRSTSLRIIDRLVYSTLLSISSGIAFVLFMDIVLDVNTPTRTISLIICVFAELALMFWGVTRWYRDRRLQDRREPQLPAEERQILKDAFDAVIEKPREIPVRLAEIPKRPVVQPGFRQKEIQKRMEFKLRVEPIRKLQREILRDMDMIHVTPDSFSRSKKNMENIRIPEKSDVRKRLADVNDEVKDLDWLYD